MLALPANIHPRAYFTQQNPAPYRPMMTTVTSISGRQARRLGGQLRRGSGKAQSVRCNASTAVDKTCMHALSATAPIAA